GRHQVARDLRGAGGRRPPRRTSRAGEARDPAGSRASQAGPRPVLRGPRLQRLWFSPTREAIDGFVAAIQPRVTGSVRLKLFKGVCHIVSRKSPFGLYDHGLATYDTGDAFDHSAAQGCIKNRGLSIETHARR